MSHQMSSLMLLCVMIMAVVVNTMPNHAKMEGKGNRMGGDNRMGGGNGMGDNMGGNMEGFVSNGRHGEVAFEWDAYDTGAGMAEGFVSNGRHGEVAFEWE